MSTVLLKCPHCRQQLAVDAGPGDPSIPCPACSGAVVVPPTSIFATCSFCGEEFEAPASMAGEVFECPECSSPVPLAPVGTQIGDGLRGARPKAADASLSCPACGAAMSPRAVICTGCGLDLRTGESVARAAGPSGTEVAVPRQRIKLKSAADGARACPRCGGSMGPGETECRACRAASASPTQIFTDKAMNRMYASQQRARRDYRAIFANATIIAILLAVFLTMLLNHIAIGVKRGGGGVRLVRRSRMGFSRMIVNVDALRQMTPAQARAADPRGFWVMDRLGLVDQMKVAEPPKKKPMPTLKRPSRL